MYAHMGRLVGALAVATSGVVGASVGSAGAAARHTAPARQAARRGSAVTPAARARGLAAYGRLPLRFEENRGQAAGDVRFLSRGAGYTFLLTPDEAVLTLAAPHPRPPSPARGRGVGGEGSSIVRLRLSGANAHPAIEGLDRLPGNTNYLLGSDRTRWRSGVASYARVAYHGVYRGVDMVYHGAAGRLEYDFVVAPGADPRAIRLDVSSTSGTSGARGPRLDARGALVLRTPGGDVTQERPVIYQQIAGRRWTVTGGYTLRGSRVSFAVGRYDARYPLVIDPVFGYSTYLGGTGGANSGGNGAGDTGTAIAVDAAGNTYVTGYTASNNFPLADAANAYQVRNRGGSGSEEVFVAKLNPSGTALVYSTYVGGTGGDAGTGIAIDGAGNAYVTGSTGSSDFPTVNAVQRRRGGRGDAFAFKLNPSGSALLYSTYLGGSKDDFGNGIAVDSAGSAYVTGATESKNFPTRNALQGANGGGRDAFVAKLTPAGGVLVYSTYLGGNGKDTGDAIAVDPTHNVFICGASGSTDLPRAHVLNNTIGGDNDAFVARLDAAGSRLVYDDLIGGNDIDEAYGIAVDGARDAYITGYTASPNYATTARAAQRRYGGGPRDAFVAKVDASGNTLLYNTLLGGNADEVARAIAIDGAGDAYVVGDTTGGAFPVTRDGLQRAYGGGAHDVFVAELDRSGGRVSYGTLLGGGDDEGGNGIAVDRLGGIYVTGYTQSSNYPIKAGAVQSALRSGNNGGNLFITKLGSSVGVPTVGGVLPNLVPASHAPGVLYIANARHSVAAPFVATYRATSGYILGDPVDEAYTRNGVLTQDFDHTRLELRGGAVVFGALGSEVSVYQRQYDGALAGALRAVAPRGNTDTLRYFPATRHTAQGAILRYWQANGGESTFGAPISEAFRDGNGDGSGRTYVMQLFQKARIELHPENGPGRYAILLGLLGP